MIRLYEMIVYPNFKCRYNLIGQQAELRFSLHYLQISMVDYSANTLEMSPEI